MRKIVIGVLVVVGLIGMIGTISSPAVAREIGPTRFDPAVDRALVQATSPLQPLTWAAWMYHENGQYDVALAVADESGYWGDPIFIGRDDGRDQIRPALGVDPAGNFYLSYQDLSSGEIMVAALAADATQWSTPVSIGRGSTPAILAVGDRIVIAFQSRRSTRIVSLPQVAATPIRGRSIYDGPDPVENSAGGGEGDDDERDNPDDDQQVDFTGFPVRPLPIETPEPLPRIR